MKTTKVLVAGFTGAMGKKVLNLINQMPGFEVGAVYSPTAPSQNPTDYALAENVPVFTALDEIHQNATIWVDFSVPEAATENVAFALAHGMFPVVGTTGMSEAAQHQLITQAAQLHRGGIIAPNFGLSAVLLMKFAAIAAQYFPDAEIVEMHHADKQDAPSGTALATAQAIAAARNQKTNTQSENLAARGTLCNGVPVHAVRLPGYVAHEQVLFGAPGEALTIRQDSFDRESFMAGVRIALQKVTALDHMVVGLENLL
ncbi:4-hydroxy-tetrahydrodipicolinate reductase [Ligilactobacillus sp. LYQ139]|uniref:4-hydroxy-tetrahydrodipicolinate reductase n=1 Tax=Ligilactobacillus sp. LYQ139 TaxID=3378800 RepID=UPI003852D443